MTSPHDLRNFWRQVFALRGSVTLQVLPRVLTFGAIAAAIWIINELTHEFDFHLAVAPYEVAGAVLGLLLVLRTNAGYDRWWEARKLWGGIVNQSMILSGRPSSSVGLLPFQMSLVAACEANVIYPPWSHYWARRKLQELLREGICRLSLC
jgi:predicted membrane chloride channel (bestrophin family)